jgi:hypothetical protein
VNLWRAERLMGATGGRGAADAYAIAPYFGNLKFVGATDSGVEPATSVSAQLELLERDLSDVQASVRANAALAARAGLQLIAYEGGQHVTNPQGRDDFCVALNRHPRMADLYSRYLDIWDRETGGALMMIFGDMSVFGRSGCWGLSEYHGQPAAETPKLRAVRHHLEKAKLAP